MTVGKDTLRAGKLNRLAAAVVLILVLAFMLYLTGAAFFETVSVSTDNEAGELAVTEPDNTFLNSIAMALMLSALYLFYRHFDDVSLKRLELLLMLWVFGLGLGFIASVKLSAPWFSDAYIVTDAALRAAQGDLSGLELYFVRFPFQLGFVLYEELVFRVMGAVLPGMPEGYYCLALQGVNLLWLALCYHALIRTVILLFADGRAAKLTVLLLIFCLPPVLSCTFLYGNIPALGCGAAAVWMFAAFFTGRRWLHGLLCAVLLGLAAALKLNMLIFFVAIALLWLLELLRKCSLRSVVCLLLAAVSVFLAGRLPQDLYESRCETDFGQGIPMIAWMAMGFSQGHAGPGWYSEEHTVDSFRANKADPEATATEAQQALKERMEYFRREPAEALRFFSAKLKTQWNEPSYESLWINQIQSSYGEKKGLYEPICGRGERRSLAFMGQYQQLIFLGLLLSVPVLWKKRDSRKCVLLVIILGGMLYHLLFEAKSQYSLSYFVLMVPMAARGLSGLFHVVEKR